MVTSTAYKRPAYPAYKPSDVEWLGEIPEGWEKLRLKHIASINDEVLSEATAPDYELLYVDIGNVEAIYGIQKKEQMRFENAPSRARRRVRDGDVIVSTVRTYLRAIAPVVEPESNLIVSTGFAVVRPRQRLENIFAAYVLRAPYFVDTVVSRSVGVSYPAVNASDIADIHLVVPPSSEQRAIAAFLDRETVRVDVLIEKKQRQVELLQEKRTTLISRAVTKGLDPNAKMKDSGIEWLGEIPEGWEKLRVKHIASINDEVLSEATAPDYELLYVDIGSVEAIYGIQKKEQMRFENAPSRARRRVRDGDVIVSTVRTYLRAIAPVVEPESNLVVSTGFAVVRPRQRFENIFAAYVLRAPYFVDTVVSRSVGVSYPAVNASDIADIHLVVPPSSEQRAIAAFLDRETARIDALIEKVEASIDLLSEYRTALISAAVTGKIDVRKEAA